jgi:hypothetical protein
VDSLLVFFTGTDHKPVLGQGVFNEPKFVKTGCLELSFKRTKNCKPDSIGFIPGQKHKRAYNLKNMRQVKVKLVVRILLTGTVNGRKVVEKEKKNFIQSSSFYLFHFHTIEQASPFINC